MIRRPDEAKTQRQTLTKSVRPTPRKLVKSHQGGFRRVLTDSILIHPCPYRPHTPSSMVALYYVKSWTL